jgi:hypothetical protein
MTIQQTIEIPASRRVVIEIPETFTSGTLSVILLDTYMERHHAENALEAAIDELNNMKPSTSVG